MAGCNDDPCSPMWPTPYGLWPVVAMTGNIFKRVNAPANPSVFIYNSGKCYWADGSAEIPIPLPNIQEVAFTGINYLLGVNSSGDIVKIPITSNEILTCEGATLTVPTFQVS